MIFCIIATSGPRGRAGTERVNHYRCVDTLTGLTPRRIIPESRASRAASEETARSGGTQIVAEDGARMRIPRRQWWSALSDLHAVGRGSVGRNHWSAGVRTRGTGEVDEFTANVVDVALRERRRIG